GLGDRTAINWEGEPGDSRSITYAELKDQVSQAANAITSLGVTKGDRVAIYMPMIPETVVAMLACARIGAVHMVIFGGFSSARAGERLDDGQDHLVVSADGGSRRGQPSRLEPAIGEAVADGRTVENVLVVRSTGQEVEWN